jgi:hypothetical protein
MTRRVAVALLALAAAPVIGTATAARPAAADSIVPVRNGDYTYTVDLAARVVHVEADIRVANTSAEGARACYEGFRLKVPVGVTGVRASDRNDPLTVTVLDPQVGAPVTELEVTLLECLDYGRQKALRVTYDLPSGAPRTAAPVRVGDGYVAFVAWAAGRAGGGSITIEAPTSLPLDTLGPDWRITVDGAVTTYYKSAVADPSTYQALIAGSSDNARTTTELDVAGHRFELASWPGDDEWTGYVSGVIDAALPALEAAIGHPWPVEDTFVVRETYSPGGLGATVWPTVAGESPLTEEFDQRAVLRGLATAWFGADHFADQWLAEALADIHTDTAFVTLGGVAYTPFYPPSTAAVAQVLADLGPRAPDALGHLIDGSGAYDTGETMTPAGWQQFLDVVDEIGGSADSADLIEPVLDEAAAALLTGRDEARRAYAELQQHGDDWIAPLGVRRLMEAWSFTDAGDLMAVADKVLDQRDDLLAALDGTGAPLPAHLQGAYESAEGDLTEVTDMIDALASVAPILAAATEAERGTGGLVAWVGLIGSDVDGSLAAARAAFAEGDADTVRTRSGEVVEWAGGATFEGLKRILLTGGSLLAALVVALTIRSWRGRRATPEEVGSEP